MTQVGPMLVPWALLSKVTSEDQAANVVFQIWRTIVNQSMVSYETSTMYSSIKTVYDNDAYLYTTEALWLNIGKYSRNKMKIFALSTVNTCWWPVDVKSYGWFSG